MTFASQRPFASLVCVFVIVYVAINCSLNMIYITSPAKTKGLLLFTNNLGVIRGLFVDTAPFPKRKKERKKTVSQHLCTATLAAL